MKWKWKAENEESWKLWKLKKLFNDYREAINREGTYRPEEKNLWPLQCYKSEEKAKRSRREILLEGQGVRRESLLLKAAENISIRREWTRETKNSSSSCALEKEEKKAEGTRKALKQREISETALKTMCKIYAESGWKRRRTRNMPRC